MSPDDCGYSGRILKAASKGPLYITPLQEVLDTSPLPPTSEAFSKMPKAACQKCETLYPLQVLAEHVKSCEVTIVDASDNVDSDANEPNENKC